MIEVELSPLESADSVSMGSHAEEEDSETISLMTRNGSTIDRTGSSEVAVDRAASFNTTNQAMGLVDEELDTIPTGLFHTRTVIILGIGNASDAVEIMAMGYILPKYEESEGELTAFQSSFLTAAVFAGMLIGGFAGGVLSDSYGRRPLLVAHLSINAISAVLAALSPSVQWLILFRIIAGYGVGGTVSALFALCAEHVPSPRRGFYVTILCSFWMVGSILTAGMAWIMLGEYVGGGGRILDVSWRWFAFLVAFPSFSCLVLTIAYVPESARYLASKGKLREAENVLKYIHSIHQTKRAVHLKLSTEGSKIPSGVGSIDSPYKRDTRSEHWWDRISLLFHKKLVRGTCLLLVISYFQSFGSYGLATWITKLYTEIGLSNPFANAFLYAGANAPGNLISAYLVDRVSRSKLLCGSMLLAGSSSVLFAMNTESSPSFIVFVSCLFNASATSAWNAFGVVSAEAFPTVSRASGMSITNCVGRVGAISAQFVNAYLSSHVTALLLITSAAMISGAMAALSLPLPSRGAKSVVV